MKVKYVNKTPLAITHKGKRKTLREGDKVNLSEKRIQQHGEHRFQKIEQTEGKEDE